MLLAIVVVIMVFIRCVLRRVLVVRASFIKILTLFQFVKVRAKLVELFIEMYRGCMRKLFALNIPMIALSCHNLQLKSTSNFHIIHLSVFQELRYNIIKLIYDTIWFLKYLEACGTNCVIAGIIEKVFAPIIHRALRKRIFLLDWKFY